MLKIIYYIHILPAVYKAEEKEIFGHCPRNTETSYFSIGKIETRRQMVK